MKLIKIENKRTRPGMASITFRKAGMFRISAAAVRALGLKPHIGINFYFDQQNPMDIYFAFEAGGTVLRGLDNTDALMGNSATVARKVLATIGKDSANIRISTEPENGYYALITKAAL